MNACFESINYVKTKYCTFLYDDDLLSPYINKFFKLAYSKDIVMGYGLVNINNSKIIFYLSKFIKYLQKKKYYLLFWKKFKRSEIHAS